MCDQHFVSFLSFSVHSWIAFLNCFLLWFEINFHLIKSCYTVNSPLRANVGKYRESQISCKNWNFVSWKRRVTWCHVTCMVIWMNYPGAPSRNLPQGTRDILSPLTLKACGKNVVQFFDSCWWQFLHSVLAGSILVNPNLSLLLKCERGVWMPWRYMA